MIKALSLFVALSLVGASSFAFEVKSSTKVGDYVEVVTTPASAGQGNLDILFVIDNSGSMASYQMTLQNNIALMINAIGSVKGASIHAGVTTTDGEAKMGQLVGSPRVAVSSSPNFESDLMRNMLVGTYGSPYEMLFSPTIAALSEPLASTHNAGFRRADSHLAVVFLTDAEDQSKISSDDFVSQITAIGSMGLSTYGFIIPSNIATGQSSGCYRDNNEEPVLIEGAISRLNGEIYNICEADFGKNLGTIGSKLAVKIDRLINLPNIPQLATVSVRYGTTMLQFGDARLGWTYDSIENAVIIGDMVDFSTQPLGTEIRVRYTPIGW